MKTILITLIIILFAIVVGTGILLFVRQKELGLTPPIQEIEVETTGAIQGTLSYPSEGIPAEMQICAENMEGEQVACTNEHIQIPTAQRSSTGYLLEVPAGTYYVYASLPSNPEQKAYYSEFVTCGLLASCPSHDPIKIDLAAGGTATQVNPHDWYADTP